MRGALRLLAVALVACCSTPASALCPGRDGAVLAQSTEYGAHGTYERVTLTGLGYHAGGPWVPGPLTRTYACAVTGPAWVDVWLAIPSATPGGGLSCEGAPISTSALPWPLPVGGEVALCVKHPTSWPVGTTVAAVTLEWSGSPQFLTVEIHP